ncbi:MAG: hypothetical protein HY692_03670 [Cyanobacteria bacterium NC_groundwater_1444_Ag_S-0.65um_54_12]|nr:hypothetical protein [Cyanobacteria bacterium NC_groundwater_1444_Ag_S-0.65um_54_12]
MDIEAIMALSIPIVAIVVWSPIGKAIGEFIRALAARSTPASVSSQSQIVARFEAIEAELQQIRETLVLAPNPNNLASCAISQLEDRTIRRDELHQH